MQKYQKIFLKNSIWRIIVIMEIKRKKITQEEIFATEQKLSQNITQICNLKNSAFLAIGYELDLEFGQKENEHQSQFEIFSQNENKKFDPGYVSRAMITVKRQKTEEEKQADRLQQEENLRLIENCENGQETEQLNNDETLRLAEDEEKRSVAFTRVMLVRSYKSFWTEWVSLGEDLGQLEADLDEFLEVLTQKQNI